MEDFYIHSYEINEDDGVRLVYLRKTTDIDPKSKTDDIDNLIYNEIMGIYPEAKKEEITSTNESGIVQKCQDQLKEYKHLTAVLRFISSEYSDIIIGSLLVPHNVDVTKYGNIGSINPIDENKEKQIFGSKECNWPIILHHCPLLNGIYCRICREEKTLYFLYHTASLSKVIASVNMNKNIVNVMVEGEPGFNTQINAFIERFKNGNLKTLVMNKEKKLFSEAKNLLLDNLKGIKDCPDFIQDYIIYLENAEEL